MLALTEVAMSCRRRRNQLRVHRVIVNREPRGGDMNA
jgi:hypothetical protein